MRGRLLCSPILLMDERGQNTSVLFFVFVTFAGQRPKEEFLGFSCGHKTDDMKQALWLHCSLPAVQFVYLLCALSIPESDSRPSLFFVSSEEAKTFLSC